MGEYDDLYYDPPSPRKQAGLEHENGLLRARVAELEEALVWCGGSADFAPGGQARIGWETMCMPLIAPRFNRERKP